MKNKSIRQLRLFDISEYEVEPKPKAPTWFYIVSSDENRMVVGYNGEGRPVWDEHDLQFIRPNLYNNSRAANEDIKRLSLNAKCKSCRYQVIGGQSVWD